jgi:3-hydroxybutyryl-CoA dehydratase
MAAAQWRPLITGTLKWDPALGTLAVGMCAELRRTILAPDVAAYAALLGDCNPLHLDAAFAARTPFKRPIAHGMLSAGLIPTIFGATIPAAVYVSQTLSFRRPVYVGDAVTARVTVTGVRLVPVRGSGGSGAQQQQPLVTCATVVLLDATGKAALEGESVCLLPPLPAGAAGEGAGQLR